MKIRALLFVGALSVANWLPAAEKNLTEQFQQALLEEEANRNLPAAIEGYEAVIRQLDAQRQLAATAVFRMGESYRKLGRTNDAVRAYERILSEFQDQEALVKLSEQNLSVLRPLPETLSDEYVIKPGDSLTRIAREYETTSGQLMALNPGLDPRVLHVGDRIRIGPPVDATLRRLTDMRDQLKARELDLIGQFTAQHPLVVEVTTQLRNIEDQIEQVQSKNLNVGTGKIETNRSGGLADIQLERDRLKFTLDGLQAMDRDNLVVAIQTVFPDAYLAKLDDMLSEKRSKLVGLRAEFGPDNFQIQTLVESIKYLEQDKDQRISGLLKAAEAKLAVLEQLMKAGVSTTTGSPSSTRLAPADRTRQKELLEQEIALVEGQLTEVRKRVDVGVAPTTEPLNKERELVHLQRQLAALDSTPDSLKRQRELLHRELDLMRQLTADARIRIENGKASNDELVELERQLLQTMREGLNLNQQPVANSTAAQATTTMTADEAEELRRVQALVANSPDLINKSGSGDTPPLHLAIKQGHLNVVRFLLANGASTTATDKSGRTPLYVAAWNGQLSAIQLLLDAGVDIDQTLGNGYTSLHAATWAGNDAVMKFLLENGANPDAQDDEGKTPLHQAAQLGSTNSIALLVSGGANLELSAKRQSQRTDNSGGSFGYDGTPLVFAVANEQPTAATQLLEMGANPSPITTTDSPLMLAIRTKNLDLMNELLKAGADIESDPLVHAAVSRFPAAVIPLLKAGVDPNVSYPDSNTTPLIEAMNNFVAQWNQEPATRAVSKVAHTVPTTPRAIPTRTMRTGAVSSWRSIDSDVDWASIVEAMVENGADPNLFNVPRYTALMSLWRTTELPLEMLRWLLEHGADPNAGGGEYTLQGHTYYSSPPLRLAAESGSMEAIRLLLEHGAEFGGDNWGGTSALHSATNSEHPDVVKLLLETGADPNAKDQSGRTPLFLVLDKYLVPGRYSSMNQNPFRATKELGYHVSEEAVPQKEAEILEIARTLLAKGARVDYELADGYLPIHFAAAMADPRFLELFLEFKADPNVTNSAGITPLHVAASTGHENAIRLLVAAGAEINRQDENGNTPLHLAVLGNQVAASEALLELGANKDLTNGFGVTPSQSLGGDGKRFNRLGPFQLPFYVERRKDIRDVLGK